MALLPQVWACAYSLHCQGSTLKPSHPPGQEEKASCPPSRTGNVGQSLLCPWAASPVGFLSSFLPFPPQPALWWGGIWSTQISFPSPHDPCFQGSVPSLLDVIQVGHAQMLGFDWSGVWLEHRDL